MGGWHAGTDGRTDVINARVLVVLVVFVAVLARSWVRYQATRPFSGTSILIFDIESAGPLSNNVGSASHDVYSSRAGRPSWVEFEYDN